MFSSETEALLALSCWRCFSVNVATHGCHLLHCPAGGNLSAFAMGASLRNTVEMCPYTCVVSLTLSAHPQTRHTEPPLRHPLNPSVVFSCKFDICSEDRTCSWRYQPPISSSLHLFVQTAPVTRDNDYEIDRLLKVTEANKSFDAWCRMRTVANGEAAGEVVLPVIWLDDAFSLRPV